MSCFNEKNNFHVIIIISFWYFLTYEWKNNETRVLNSHEWPDMSYISFFSVDKVELISLTKITFLSFDLKRKNFILDFGKKTFDSSKCWLLCSVKNKSRINSMATLRINLKSHKSEACFNNFHRNWIWFIIQMLDASDWIDRWFLWSIEKKFI